MNQDDAWHFYLRSTITLHLISSEGNNSKILIGNDFSKNETPQFVVSSLYWSAARVIQPNGFAFVGWIVAPGFDFEDFELGDANNFKREVHNTLTSSRNSPDNYLF